jgi:peptidoglycan/xylan/chitin deacetylase (PgdA/CDA1 family)
LFAIIAISPFYRVSSALLSLALWVHPPPPRDPPTVTVLCYHNFGAQKITPYNLELKRFRDEMRYLAVQRIPVIPLAQYAEHLRTGAPLPDHSVVITIDDGYKTARTIAWPLLRKYHFPFTVFIYPQYIGKPSGLSWEDVKVLSDAGVDMESHSLTHPLLTHPQKPMSRTEYIAWIDQELREPKRILAEHTGKPVRFLAYPFGGYDELIVDRTRKAGYELALTCDDGNVTRMTDPLHVNRRLVYRQVRLREFSDYFPDRTLQVTDQAPRDGERVRKPFAAIEARVQNVREIRPGSAFAYVDKLGRHPIEVKIDPKSGRFSIPVPPVHRSGYYFVSLFARDRVNPLIRREASWLFIVSKNASRK